MRQKWVESASGVSLSNQGSDLFLQGVNHRLKMAHTATEIGSIVQELALALAEGWIQKISQPLPDSLLLEVRVPGHTRRLLCSVRDGTARIHLVRETLPNPPTPPSFANCCGHAYKAHVSRALHLSLATALFA